MNNHCFFSMSWVFGEVNPNHLSQYVDNLLSDLIFLKLQDDWNKEECEMDPLDSIIIIGHFVLLI